MRILYLDIETAPNLGYTWAKYEQNVLSFERERYMMCFSYRWHGEDETHVVSQIDFKTAYKRDRFDDSRVCKAVWDLLDEADIVIGHNIVKFDLKMINGFFLVNGIHRPSPYQTVDTLTIARSAFKLNSNSLKDLCKVLGLDHKRDAGGFETWLGCMDGNIDAWNHMIEYAKRDTELLQPLYERLREWAKSHPSLNFEDPDNCPTCNAPPSELVRRGTRRSKVNQWQTWCCKKCHSYSQTRLSWSTADTRPRKVSVPS